MGKNILAVQPPLRLKKDFRKAIARLCGRESATRSELRRAGIVLRMDDVPVNFSELEKETGHCRDTIRCWYRRVSYANGLWEEMAGQILRETGHAGPMLRKERLVSRILADRPRSGAPCKYSSMQYTDIAVMALKPPSEFGRPTTHWTARELADEVRLRGVGYGNILQTGRPLSGRSGYQAAPQPILAQSENRRSRRIQKTGFGHMHPIPGHPRSSCRGDSCGVDR